MLPHGWNLEAPVIAQTLHGYDQGHRLLARGGDVDDAELALLDRLSDLSGYVPLGTEFERYHTGFACGRYYAFACTWPDRTAIRAGTVLTHTLLVPREALDRVHDLSGLHRFHRRPESAADREPYTVAASLDLNTAPETPPIPSTDRAAAAIALWFGQHDRPVLWVEDVPPDDIVCYLWRLLWPEARERFSFCTFALQVRHLWRRPFGFLALPPAARGSFHERARSSAWWQDGQPAIATLRERAGQAWVRAILEGGAKVTRSMPQFCKDHALASIAEPEFPVFHRFIELDEPARARLTAARARADLLDRLWPDLTPEHPLVRATLRQLLLRQGDAPLEPRPFWELGDFIRRPAVSAFVRADLEFAATLEQTLTNEVRRRLVDATPEGASGMTVLLGPDMDTRIHRAIVEAVQAAFTDMPDEQATYAKARALLLGSVGARAPFLTEAVLAALPPGRRAHTVLQALEAAPEDARAPLTDQVLTAARRLDDVPLVSDLWTALHRPLYALRDATSIVLSSSVVSPERLDPVLAHLGAEDQLEWALRVTERPLAAWAGFRGAGAAKALQLSLSELIERCGTAPNGGHVLVAHLDQLPVDPLHDDELLSAPVAAALASDAAGSPAAKRVADRIAIRLVRRLAGIPWNVEESTAWLRLAVIQRALADADPWTLFSGDGARAWSGDCVPNLARAIGAYVVRELPQTMFWIPNLLARPLEEVWSMSLSRAAGELESILALPPDLDGWTNFAAEVLVAVRRTGCPGAHRLVELAFPVLYHRFVREALDPASRTLLSRFRADGWDVAKSWRHWLLDSWLDRRWPPASFLHCLGGDESLFRRIGHRALRKRSGRELLGRLPGALAGDPILAAQWSEPVARFLADSHAAPD
jgi:hypothetical protein